VHVFLSLSCFSGSSRSKSDDFELNSTHLDFQWIPIEKMCVLKRACDLYLCRVFSATSRAKSDDSELNSSHFDFQWIPREKGVLESVYVFTIVMI
jgi:hypothetical protein